MNNNDLLNTSKNNNNTNNQIKEINDNFKSKQSDILSNKEESEHFDNEDDFYNKDDYLNSYDLHTELNLNENSNQENSTINNKSERDLIKESEEFKKKIRKSGVIYISYIPEGLTVALIRIKLAKYKVLRVYLKPISGKKNHFKEGWIEFEDKILAKLCEFELNGKPIGGKKRESIREELWCLKYLHKFKWYHLIEKMQIKQKEKEQKLKNTLSQAHREGDFIAEALHQSKRKKKRDELFPNSVDDYKRQPKQIKHVKK